MKQKIKKINNLTAVESFIQINFLKGFKYIDTAGEVLNHYQQDDGSIAYNMSPNRLIIQKPTKDVKELRVSVSDLWFDFVAPANFGHIRQIFANEAQQLLAISDVNRLRRVGWRTYFVLDLNEDIKSLGGTSKISGANVESATFAIKFAHDVEAKITVSLLEKEDSGGSAIKFDTDFFVNAELSREELDSTLNVIRDAMHSDETIAFMNEILGSL